MQLIPTSSINSFNPAKRFIRGLACKDWLVPIILLECFVTGGRTYQAYKRDGIIEARERFTEEVIGAAFWFGGVKGFNAMNDKIGQKLFKFPNYKDMKFDGGKDALRDPMKNFIAKHAKMSENKLAVFKFAKVISSILLANALVGFVVPKINQHITRKYFLEKRRQAQEGRLVKQPTMDNFMSKKQVSFKGNPYGILMSLAHEFENNARYQLLSTDAGIAGGRAISARNNHERIEVLFRDLSSIYFYLFSMPHINKLLNLIQDRRATRLDPVIAELTTKQMEKFLKNNGGKMSELELIGDKNIKLPSGIKFTDHVIKLDEFLKHVPAELVERAKLMSQLQPEINGIGRVLSEKQAEAVFHGGILNEPQFLADIYNITTDGNFQKKFKFIERSSLESINKDLLQYAESIIKKAGNSQITLDTIKKACRENLVKNCINWGAGFAVSAWFLSTLIPKMQYWITKKTTGRDTFPGITDYSDKK